MEPFPVLVASLAAALTLGALALLRPRRFSAAAAIVPVALAALLVVFVAMDDTYRDNGTSRWDAYRSPGGALGPLFAASLLLLAGCALALARTGLAHRSRAYRLTAILGALAVLLVVLPTVVGFSVN
jgi:cell division protein FtsW (lipid II flippase)